MRQTTKRLGVAALFGGLIFVSKTVVPSPIDKMLIIVQAILLALGALIIRDVGATYVALIGGVLTALWRTAFAPFTLLFALLYGLLVDGFFFLFKVAAVDDEVITGRVMVAMTLSTALVGLLSYYITAVLTGLIPRNLGMEVGILIVGTLSGAMAGYFAAIIWNKHLRNANL